jgi:hypothetical protein
MTLGTWHGSHGARGAVPPSPGGHLQRAGTPRLRLRRACGMAAEAPERREEFDGGQIMDISHYYREDMPAWESSEGVGEFLRLARSMRNGSDIANFSDLRLTAHSGHADVVSPKSRNVLDRHKNCKK